MAFVNLKQIKDIHMKKIKLLLLILFLPIVMIAQELKPSNFYGIIVFEENKTIEYSYLNNPICGTAVSYFNHLPSSSEFTRNLKQELLPLSRSVLSSLLSSLRQKIILFVTIVRIAP